MYAGDGQPGSAWVAAASAVDERQPAAGGAGRGRAEGVVCAGLPLGAVGPVLRRQHAEVGR
eukprot:1543663-Rhodomonas_salina.4